MEVVYDILIFGGSSYKYLIHYQFEKKMIILVR